MGLEQLLYASDAVGRVSDADLAVIGRVSVANNMRAQITGILLYNDGHFVQLLEGEGEAIRSLYERIIRDDRHTNVKLLMQRPTKQRLFKGWSMGTLNLEHHSRHEQMDMDDLVHLAGYDEQDDQGLPIGLSILKRFRGLLEAA